MRGTQKSLIGLRPGHPSRDRRQRDFIAQSAYDGAAVLIAQADNERREISRYARNDVREVGKKKRRAAPFEMTGWGEAATRRSNYFAGKDWLIQRRAWGWREE
jgi:hypothetical protein